MISLRRPSTAAIHAFLASQSGLGLTYAEVGAAAVAPPAGYVVDRTRARLGEGEEVFRRAGDALRRWEQFRLGWLEALPPDTRLRTGEVVAVVARQFGVWMLGACRIVYVIDEEEPIRRFGFAYGTPPDHAGAGEERFLIEWDRASGEVWYDVLASSRPKWRLARLLVEDAPIAPERAPLRAGDDPPEGRDPVPAGHVAPSTADFRPAGSPWETLTCGTVRR